MSHAVDELERIAAHASDHSQFQAESLEVIRTVVDFDVAIHTSVDPASMLDTTCIPFGMPHDPDREMRHFELEYRTDTPLAYRELALRPERAAALRIEVDDPTTVPRFQEMIEPNGGHDEIRATFVTGDQCWGSVTLYRMIGRPAFTREEVGFFTRISDVMARGLRRSFLHAAIRRSAEVDEPPGHLTVDRSGRIVTTTASAEQWLETLEPHGRTPAVLASLVAALDHRPSVSATVTGSDGPLTLHASPMKGTNETIGVIIERPRPIDLAAAITQAHGLTPREAQVAGAVMRGYTTRQIANSLGMAEYTVQDHLKAVFSKVGVVSRGELTFELFIRHYLGPTRAGSTPSPYGYYLDPPAGDGPNGR